MYDVRRRIRTLGWLAATLVGATAGGITFRVAAGSRDARARAHAVEVASERGMVVRLGLADVLQVLSALRARMLGDPLVTREEFRLFGGNLRRSHPGYQAFEWIPRVAGRDRAAFEARAEHGEASACAIRARAPDGRFAPAPPADVHFPILYAEPSAGNEAVLGFDLGSEALRRRAVVDALGSGRPTLSDPLRLVQETGSSTGYLALLAVPGDGAQGDPAAPEGARGVVAVVLRASPLLAEFLSPGPVDAEAPLTYRVTDETAPSRPVDLLPATAPPPPGGGAWHEESIEFGTRRWRLRAYPTAAFLARHSWTPAFLLAVVAGTLGAALTGLLALGAGRVRGRALRERDRILRCVCGSLNEGVVVADERGRFVFWNQAAETMVGMGSTDSPSGEWSSRYGVFLPDGVTPYPPDHLPLVRAARGEPVEETDLLVRNSQVPRGRWLRISGAPIVDEAASHRGGVVVFRDVTERRQSEARILHLVNAVEQTADAVLMTDPEGRIAYVNHAFEVMTGWTSAEVVGQTPRILKSGVHDAAFYRDLWGRLTGGQVHRGTIVNRRKDGTTWHSEQTITPVRDASGRITQFVSVMKDMTERRRAMEQEAELALAARVQRRLYPRRPPDVPGVEVGGFVISAAATCGDYYDWAALGEGRLGLVVGDVVGHGLGPALIMAATRAYLRVLAQLGLTPDEVLRRLSDMLEYDLDDGQFVTMVVARIDVPRRELLHANAGHPPGWVLNAEGVLKATLGRTGLPLGLVPDAAYASPAVLPLAPGDLVVLLTDGITECRDADGELLEETPVLEVVREHVREPVAVILDRLRERLTGFRAGHPMEDDATILVCRLL